MLTASLEAELIALCSDLLQIKSYSGAEQDIVRRLEAVFAGKTGWELQVDAYGSLCAGYTGRRPGKRVLFDAHVDTVPVTDPEHWAEDPFGGVVRDGRIYGRGASDMKGALAAMIVAAEAFIADTKGDFAGEVVISGVVQEESFEGIAARSISQNVNPDFVIIGEASDLNLKHGQRGRAEIVLETVGRAAHSANPGAGLNAVYPMSELIAGLRELPVPKHPVLGQGILELTDIISSPYPGLSVVPETCRATCDRRLLVDETRDSVLQPIQELLQRTAAGVPDLQVHGGYAFGRETCYTGQGIETERFFPAWLLDPSDPFVQSACRGLQRAGLQPELAVYSFCTNGAHYAGEANIPSIGFGPSSESQAHVRDEWIAVEQLLGACRGYYGLMLELLHGRIG